MNLTGAAAGLGDKIEMKTRVLAAAALLPLLLIIVLALPPVFTAILFGAACAVAAYELLFRTGLVKNIRLVIYAALMGVGVSFWGWAGCPRNFAVAGILVYTALLFGEMLLAHTQLRFEKVCLCFAAGLLLPYLLTSLVRILVMDGGKFYILTAFVIAFSADSGAYFVGRAMGKHKLARVISPNKTVEGAIGGVLSAVIGMVLYSLILQLFFDLSVNYLYAIIYGVLGSGASILGDLAFSVVKRQNQVKDYGNLIPGHGGVLDRFDSMMMVAPLTEALLLMIPFAV